MQNLRQKSIQSIKWSAVAQFSNYFLKFTLGVILARLLSPAEFGVVAMVTVISEISNFFIDGGFSASLIQNRKIDNRDLSTVFYVNLGLGIFFMALLMITAPLFSKFYNDIRLTSIARAISFLYLLTSVNVVQKAQLSRNLDFKKLSIIEVVQQILGGTLGIALALLGFSYWSIVYKRIFQELMRLVMYYRLTKWIPLPVFKLHILKKHWRYSSWALLSGIAKQISDRFDYIIIGKLFTAADLGIFQRGKTLAWLPVEFTASVFNNPLFASFSKLQGDKAKFLKNYILVYRIITFLVLPVIVLSFILADQIIFILLGEKWTDASLFLKYFSLASLIYIMSLNKFRLLSALGFPKYNAYYNTFDLIFKPLMIVLFVFVLGYKNMDTIAIIFIFSFFLRFLYSSTKLANQLDTTFRVVAFVNYKELMGTLISGGLLWLIMNQFSFINNYSIYYSTSLFTIIYVLLLTGFILLFNKPLVIEMKMIFLKRK